MNINIKIAVADSSAIIRSGIEAALKRIPGLRIHVDEISGADAFYEYIKKQQPDILIVNPSFLGYYSLSVLKDECGCSHLKCVALLYAMTDHSLLKQYDDFITIYDSQDEIKNKIEKISNQYEKNKTKGEEELQTLSVREKEIVVCVVKGFTNKEIAEHLFLSTHTVITHRRNIARKLQIHSASGLTVYAIVNKLVALNDIKK